ncbi:MAG: disulfide bond formation protein B [Janthinobacterium lividum]
MPIHQTLDIETGMRRDRALLVLLAILSLALVAGALYLQYFRGEDPCPLCILQRYGYILAAIFALAGAVTRRRGPLGLAKGLVVLAGIGGAIAAGRHLYVLSRPMFSCGFDVLQPIVDGLPPAKILPGVFKVAGLCETPYPPLLGLSLPAWSLIGFLLIVVLVGVSLFRRLG